MKLITQGNQNHFENTLQQVFNSTTPGVYYGIIEELTTWMGTQLNAYDIKEVQKTPGQKIKNITTGGTMLLFPGNVGIIFISHKFGLAFEFLMHLLKKIELPDNTHISLLQHKNDLKINNKKVAGYGFGLLQNGLRFEALNINLNMNKDLINSICTKYRDYDYGDLREFNVTYEKIISWLEEFVNNEDIKTMLS